MKSFLIAAAVAVVLTGCKTSSSELVGESVLKTSPVIEEVSLAARYAASLQQAAYVCRYQQGEGQWADLFEAHLNLGLPGLPATGSSYRMSHSNEQGGTDLDRWYPIRLNDLTGVVAAGGPIQYRDATDEPSPFMDRVLLIFNYETAEDYQYWTDISAAEYKWTMTCFAR